MKSISDNKQIKIAKSKLPIYSRKITTFAGKWPIKRTVNLHNHTFFELEIVTEGNAKTIINNSEYPLSPGSLYIMRPTDIHSIILEENTQLNLRNFCFLENAVSDEVLDFLISNSFDNIIQIPEDKLGSICSLHDIIYDCLTDNNTENNKLVLKAADLMLSLVIKEMKHTSNTVDNKYILKAINFMREHFSEDISIDDVAKHTGLTVPYFSSMFHSTLGTKYKDYLTSLRIAHARKLIKTTKKSITEICYESGFNSFSSFHRAFVNVVHTTPAKYVHSTIPEFEPGKIRGHMDE